MSRRSRKPQPETIYHLISRFVAREWFIRNDADRRQYLELFGRAIVTSDWRCLAFGVMSNHIHLALIAGTEPLASWLGEAHGPFAEWINERHERIGSVFVRGPKAIGVQTTGLARLIAYIHRNPVRAGLVQHARDSTWTSHRAYLEPRRMPPWLDVHKALEVMGFENGAAFDEWVDATPVQRQELDAFRLEPLKRGGRPKKPGTGLGFVCPGVGQAADSGCVDPRTQADAFDVEASDSEAIAAAHERASRVTRRRAG